MDTELTVKIADSSAMESVLGGALGGASSCDAETAPASLFLATWKGGAAAPGVVVSDIHKIHEIHEKGNKGDKGDKGEREKERGEKKERDKDKPRKKSQFQSQLQSQEQEHAQHAQQPQPVITSITGRGTAVLPGDPNPAHLPVLQCVVLVYRVSSLAAGAGTNTRTEKKKPEFISNETCVLNFVAAVVAFTKQHPDVAVRVIAIKDKCNSALAGLVDYAFDCVLRVACPTLIYEHFETALGSNAASFCYALDALRALPPSLLSCSNSVGVYLCEGDYLHNMDALSTILGGLALAPLSAGYDHPDKFVNAQTTGVQGVQRVQGNPFVHEGGEVCRVLLGARSHYKTTNSTTMTFCATLKTLLQDDAVLRTACETEPPDDFHMFLSLGAGRGRTLVTPLPAACTHGETALLAPLFPAAKLGAKAEMFLKQLDV